MAFAIGSFQPGTLLLGRVHTETFYQKVMGTQSLFDRVQAPASPREPEEALQELPIQL